MLKCENKIKSKERGFYSPPQLCGGVKCNKNPPPPQQTGLQLIWLCNDNKVVMMWCYVSDERSLRFHKTVLLLLLCDLLLSCWVLMWLDLMFGEGEPVQFSSTKLSQPVLVNLPFPDLEIRRFTSKNCPETRVLQGAIVRSRMFVLKKKKKKGGRSSACSGDWRRFRSFTEPSLFGEFVIDFGTSFRNQLLIVNWDTELGR